MCPYAASSRLAVVYLLITNSVGRNIALRSDIASALGSDQFVESLCKGDLKLDDSLCKNAVKEDLFHGQQLLWKSGIVPFEIADEIPGGLVKEYIMEAMGLVSAVTCIQFFPRTNQLNYLAIHYGQNFSSTIGSGSGRRDLTVEKLAPIESVRGEILHLLMHILGFGHEHNRVDRDNYIWINQENVDPGAAKYLDKSPEGRFLRVEAPYDYDSITHGGYNSHALDLDTPVLIPRIKQTKFGQRTHFSALDILKINTVYSCRNYPRLMGPQEEPSAPVLSLSVSKQVSSAACQPCPECDCSACWTSSALPRAPTSPMPSSPVVVPSTTPMVTGLPLMQSTYPTYYVPTSQSPAADMWNQFDQIFPPIPGMQRTNYPGGLQKAASQSFLQFGG